MLYPVADSLSLAIDMFWSSVRPRETSMLSSGSTSGLRPLMRPYEETVKPRPLATPTLPGMANMGKPPIEEEEEGGVLSDISFTRRSMPCSFALVGPEAR